MPRKITLVFGFFILLLTLACNPVQKKALINEARQIRTEVATLEAEISSRLKPLIYKKNSLNTQGRVLSSKEMTFVNEIEQLENQFFDLKKMLKESHYLLDLSKDVPADFLENQSPRAILNQQKDLKSSILDLKEMISRTYKDAIGQFGKLQSDQVNL